LAREIPLQTQRNVPATPSSGIRDDKLDVELGSVLRPEAQGGITYPRKHAMRWPSDWPSIRTSTSRIFAPQAASPNIDETPCKKRRMCKFAKNIADRQKTDEARVAKIGFAAIA
jgi:hypothetical protein